MNLAKFSRYGPRRARKSPGPGRLGFKKFPESDRRGLKNIPGAADLAWDFHLLGRKFQTLGLNACAYLIICTRVWISVPPSLRKPWESVTPADIVKPKKGGKPPSCSLILKRKRNV